MNLLLVDQKAESRHGSTTRLPYKTTWGPKPGLNRLPNNVRRRSCPPPRDLPRLRK